MSANRHSDINESSTAPSHGGVGNKRKHSAIRRSDNSHDEACEVNDDVGHFDAEPGDVIVSRYQIKRLLGKGTFAKVFKCNDLKRGDSVALKAVRKIERYIDSAKIEEKILNHLYDSQKQHNVDYCVDLYTTFRYNDHYFLVFEALGTSLYELIKSNNYKSLPLRCVRAVAKQLVEAMAFLKNISLVHADLKLENVVFVHSTMHPEELVRRGKKFTVSVPNNMRIKIIDFGAATYDNDRRKSTIINTRQYRGPEVILEVGWSFPSDMWGVGCILSEIYAGELLFETHDELEHLALIERCIGRFPREMLHSSRVARWYFDSAGFVRTDELNEESWYHVKDMMTVGEFFSYYSCGYSTSEVDSLAHVVKEMLRIDPLKRLTPEAACAHPFLSAADASKEGLSTDEAVGGTDAL